jgi:hypothetical protein
MKGGAYLRRVPATISGSTFFLCGDFQALVDAEAFYSRQIHGFNLAEALLIFGQDADATVRASRLILPCALHASHPNLSFDAAQKMIFEAIASNDPTIFRAISEMWPQKTAETEAANRNLHCDLDSLASANEFFSGRTGLALICVGGPFTLSHVWRIWPCALHHFRSDLTITEARKLMTLESVSVVAEALSTTNRTASKEARDTFAARVAAVMSDDERHEFLFHMMSNPWSAAALA